MRNEEGTTDYSETLLRCTSALIFVGTAHPRMQAIKWIRG